MLISVPQIRLYVYLNCTYFFNLVSPVSKISFADMNNEYVQIVSNKNDTTKGYNDIIKDFKEKYIGKRVEWSGSVIRKIKDSDFYEVKLNTSTKYPVKARISSFTPFIHVNKNIDFKGTIKDFRHSAILNQITELEFKNVNIVKSSE
jgi:hypothetical protein